MNKNYYKTISILDSCNTTFNNIDKCIKCDNFYIKQEIYRENLCPDLYIDIYIFIGILVLSILFLIYVKRNYDKNVKNKQYYTSYNSINF